MQRVEVKESPEVKRRVSIAKSLAAVVFTFATPTSPHARQKPKANSIEDKREAEARQSPKTTPTSQQKHKAACKGKILKKT